MIKILAVGDVFGTPGCEFIRRNLRRIKNAENADLVIVNAENSCNGSGLDREQADLLFASGADVLTGGNHSFRRYALMDFIEDNPYILRPLNIGLLLTSRSYIKNCNAILGLSDTSGANILSAISSALPSWIYSSSFSTFPVL